MTPAIEHSDTLGTVLVIDDEQVIVEALGRVLRADGYEVAAAPDAEKGLVMLRTLRPGVTVVDLKLPGLSGLEFLDIARREQLQTVVVLMSGFATSEHVVQSLQQGAFAFLPKPFSFEEARNVVVRAVRFRALEPSQRGVAKEGGSGFGVLGVQGWCDISPEGTARVGVTDVYMRTVGEPTRVQLPPVGYPLSQGDVLARIDDADGATYVAWSPLGGRVLEINERVIQTPGLLTADAMGEGWLARVQAASAHDDLARLVGSPRRYSWNQRVHR